MSKQVIVYTQPVCRYCGLVKTFLDGEGVQYEVRDITEKEEYKEQLLATGYQGTPVTIIGDTAVYGFNLDAIKKALVE